MYATEVISDLYYITVNGGLTALCTGFSDIRRTRIGRAPIQSPGIRVDPEETLVPAFSMSFPNCPPCVLVQELPDHCLRDCMNNCRVRRHGYATSSGPSTLLHGCLQVAVSTHMGLVLVIGGYRRTLRSDAMAARIERGRRQLTPFAIP